MLVITSHGIIQIREGEVGRRHVDPVCEMRDELVLGRRVGNGRAEHLPVALGPCVARIERHTVVVENGRVEV